MVVVVFRSRLRPGVDPAPLEPVGVRMYQHASAMPGFISYKDFAAPDGEGVSIVEFESLETLAAWRSPCAPIVFRRGARTRRRHRKT